MTLKLCSINILGLNTPEKRSQLLYSLQQSKAHIALIQETHFRTDNIPKLHNNNFPTAYHASNKDAKSKGVSILVSKHCPLQVTELQRDTQGRFLFLKGSLHHRPITIANIYAPNSQQVTFFWNTLQQLISFQSGTLNVGGDFNIALTPSLDTSNGASSLTYRALRAIKIQLSNLLLHDAWRTLHPTVKGFTFFSAHNKYSRLDHFFISQNDLTYLTKAAIDPMVLSDHNPISMTLTLPNTHTRSNIWQLDNSLLTDPANAQQITTSLSHYFAENTSVDASPITIWATHKCVIRGEFISLSAKRNKIRKARINDLNACIRILERTHKASLAASS